MDGLPCALQGAMPDVFVAVLQLSDLPTPCVPTFFSVEFHSVSSPLDYMLYVTLFRGG